MKKHALAAMVVALGAATAFGQSQDIPRTRFTLDVNTPTYAIDVVGPGTPCTDPQSVRIDVDAKSPSGVFIEYRFRDANGDVKTRYIKEAPGGTWYRSEPPTMLYVGIGVPEAEDAERVTGTYSARSD